MTTPSAYPLFVGRLPVQVFWCTGHLPVLDCQAQQSPSSKNQRLLSLIFSWSSHPPTRTRVQKKCLSKMKKSKLLQIAWNGETIDWILLLKGHKFWRCYTHLYCWVILSQYKSISGRIISYFHEEEKNSSWNIERFRSYFFSNHCSQLSDWAKLNTSMGLHNTPNHHTTKTFWM